MTDSGFTFHRNGNVTYADPRSGETYTLYAPRLGEMKAIEEYGQELSESFGIPAMQERLREITDQLAAVNDAVAAAEESGDEQAVADAVARREKLQTEVTDENNQAAQDLVRNTREQSLKWFVRVVQLVGSDNWPRQIDKGTGLPMKDEEGRDRIDVDALPAIIRNSSLVSDIKSHWWSVPLAESPSNGAASQATVTNILNS